jgi:hypothetical protein
MQNKAILHPDDIIELIVAGDQDYESIMHLYEEAKPLLGQLQTEGKPLLGLVNLEKEGKPGVTSNKAAMELLEKITYDKLAMYAAPISEIAKMIILAMGKDENTKVFKTREEALAWLKEPVKPAA